MSTVSLQSSQLRRLWSHCSEQLEVTRSAATTSEYWRQRQYNSRTTDTNRRTDRRRRMRVVSLSIHSSVNVHWSILLHTRMQSLLNRCVAATNELLSSFVEPLVTHCITTHTHTHTHTHARARMHIDYSVKFHLRHKRTDGQSDVVSPSVRLLDGVWHIQHTGHDF